MQVENLIIYRKYCFAKEANMADRDLLRFIMLKRRFLIKPLRGI